MKKLMVVVAAALMGLSVSAASVKWECDLYDLASGGTDPSAYTLYVFADGTTASTLAAALNTGGTFDSDAYSSALSGATKVTGSFDADGWADGGLSGVGDAISFLVLSDGTTSGSDFYYLSGVSTAGYTYEPPAGAPGGLYVDYAAFSSGTVGTAGGGSGDGPEPTSGLLLLVGAGILGLRRKRA